MPTPVIVGSSRLPFMKSFTHYKGISNQELLTHCLNDLCKKYHLEGKKVGEVALGALISHSSDWNIAREAVLDSLLHPDTPAFNLRRACGTSLEAVVSIANKIALGQIECGIAGGSDTNSDAPIVFSRNFAQKMIQLTRLSKGFGDKLKVISKLRPKDLLPIAPSSSEPRTKLSMGSHCELMVKEWKVSRQDQDRWALESHQKTAAAYAEGFMDDLVFSFKGKNKDGILRSDSSLEKMAKLKPVFDRSTEGSLTAANSTLLSDGAAVVFLASEEYAKKNNLPVLAKFVDAQSAAVDFVRGEGLLMAPTIAVSELLNRRKMSFDDFDFIEIHEAFAGQVLCTLKAWEDKDYCQNRLGQQSALGAISREKINVKGSSLAIGHPFAATGARITGTLSKILSQEKGKRGLISICTAGGMGAAAILES